MTAVAHAPDVVEFITDSALLGLAPSPAEEAPLRGINALMVSEIPKDGADRGEYV